MHKNCEIKCSEFFLSGHPGFIYFLGSISYLYLLEISCDDKDSGSGKNPEWALSSGGSNCWEIWWNSLKSFKVCGFGPGPLGSPLLTAKPLLASEQSIRNLDVKIFWTSGDIHVKIGKSYPPSVQKLHWIWCLWTVDGGNGYLCPGIEGQEAEALRESLTHPSLQSSQLYLNRRIINHSNTCEDNDYLL